jgi:hypothetical protein
MVRTCHPSASLESWRLRLEGRRVVKGQESPQVLLLPPFDSPNIARSVQHRSVTLGQSVSVQPARWPASARLPSRGELRNARRSPYPTTTPSHPSHDPLSGLVWTQLDHQTSFVSPGGLERSWTSVRRRCRGTPHIVALDPIPVAHRRPRVNLLRRKWYSASTTAGSRAQDEASSLTPYPDHGDPSFAARLHTQHDLLSASLAQGSSSRCSTTPTHASPAPCDSDQGSYRDEFVDYGPLGVLEHPRSDGEQVL